VLTSLSNLNRCQLNTMPVSHAMIAPSTLTDSKRKEERRDAFAAKLA